MRTKLRSKVTLLIMTCALLLAVSAVATIANELRSGHNTFTTTARNLALLTGGATDTVSVRLNQDNNDHDSPCNVDPGETLTIKAVCDNTNAATVRWAANNSDTISFVGCQGNDARNLTVASGSAGSANVTFSIITNSTGSGTYDLTSKAPFTVTVTPPPNTPPQVEVTGVAEGAFYDCVPAPGSTFPLGDTTVTCTTTDGSGNTTTSTFKVTVSKGPICG